MLQNLTFVLHHSCKAIARLIMRPSRGIIFEFTEEFVWRDIHSLFFLGGVGEGGVGRGVSWASPLL